MIDVKTMGHNIKELRLKKGKTIAEVSKETGIGETALRNYECGLRMPRYKAMFRLAAYFDKRVDDIFFA